MAVKQIVDEVELRKTIALMKPDNQLFEVRLIYGSKKILSGYFKTADKLIEAFDSMRDFKDCNIYITLNYLNEACYSRTQQDKFESQTKATTSDTDVVGYNWLMVDIDPKRPTGTSSSNEEMELARTKGNEVFAFMKKLGFYDPLLATSGNGVHLLYRVKLKNTDENKELMKKSLATLDMLFSDERIGIDVKNFNPARVCKLYGTLAQKGADSTERPHRMSKVIVDAEEIQINDIEYLKKLVSYLPEEEKPQKYNNFKPKDFDLSEWLSRYGISYKAVSYIGGTKYILDVCPFDSNHNGKDACIFQGSNGAIGFHCFHNSCADKTWRDVRLMYEPDAYDNVNKYKPQYTHNVPQIPKIVQKENEPIFLSPKQIRALKDEIESYVPTGIDGIDKRTRGLAKGCVSVVSGLRASGKSSVLSEIILNVKQAGMSTVVYSGELSAKRFMKWEYLQAAGKNHTQPTNYENFYTVSDKVKDLIDDWMEDGLSLYDNHYGNNYVAIIGALEKFLEKHHTDLVIFDNLMALDISDLSYEKLEAQKKFVLEAKRVAEKYNCHVMFVAHPRKAAGFLRLEDISGSSDIQNAVDYAFIVHRENEDFKRLSKQMFGWSDENDIYKGTNCIEISKERDGGAQDIFIPLWYEKESKRLKNNPAENVIYGWDTETIDNDGFQPAFEIPFGEV